REGGGDGNNQRIWIAPNLQYIVNSPVDNILLSLGELFFRMIGETFRGKWALGSISYLGSNYQHDPNAPDEGRPVAE
ncbi:MAG TPA: hypothetical protein VKP69_02540, partial [Isosphaeraceae bacterium]|nr:hypothetical protein [Isosphaeraceae bacterium]